MSKEANLFVAQLNKRPRFRLAIDYEDAGKEDNASAALGKLI